MIFLLSSIYLPVGWLFFKLTWSLVNRSATMDRCGGMHIPVGGLSLRRGAIFHWDGLAILWSIGRFGLTFGGVFGERYLWVTQFAFLAIVAR